MRYRVVLQDELGYFGTNISRGDNLTTTEHNQLFASPNRGCRGFESDMTRSADVTAVARRSARNAPTREDQELSGTLRP